MAKYFVQIPVIWKHALYQPGCQLDLTAHEADSAELAGRIVKVELVKEVRPHPPAQPAKEQSEIPLRPLPYWGPEAGEDDGRTAGEETRTPEKPATEKAPSQGRKKKLFGL